MNEQIPDDINGKMLWYRRFFAGMSGDELWHAANAAANDLLHRTKDPYGAELVMALANRAGLKCMEDMAPEEAHADHEDGMRRFEASRTEETH